MTHPKTPLDRRHMPHHTNDETGAILPIFALLIVVLLTFAAFAVDLGAAWGQRTLNQSAADAGVMAGGVAYIDNPPFANPGIVAEVERIVDANLGYQISALPALGGGQWAGCVDPEVTSGAFVPLADSLGSAINSCVSLSVGASVHGEKTLRVYLPEQQIDTYFARVIGINQISTGALAEAELDFVVAGGALPFVVPSGAASEYCLGEMPPGLALSPCTGSNTGKRGDIISPWHGTADPGTPACTGDMVDPTLLGWNIALGLDHLIREAGGNDTHVDWSPAAGADKCAIRDTGDIPYALVLGGGGEAANLIRGLAGNGPFGTTAGLEGLLREGAGSTRFVDGRNVPANATNMNLDNVGLWEYLDGSAPGVHCDPGHADYAADGPTATDRMRQCLTTLGPFEEGVFTTAILDSPRFAIVPEMWVNKATLDSQTPGTVTNIKRFVAVYIQATFWNCNATDCATTFQDYEDTDTDRTNDRVYFAPGEGDADSCDPLPSGSCKNNPNIALNGFSVFVLQPDWVPDAAFGGGPGEDKPVSVILSR